MNEEKLFQKNLQLWAKSAPKEAVRLPYVDVQFLAFCDTKKSELNLKKTDNRKESLYHSHKGAVREAEEWFSSLNLQDTPVLYVYGIGLGYYYEAARAWLKKNRKRYLVFLEDDLAVIHRLFQTERGSQILQDPQVQLVYFRDLKDEEAAFEVLYWNFTLTKIAVSALKYYADSKAELFSQLQHKIAYDAAVKNALVDEYMRFGGAFFINFYKNMLCLPGSYLGNDFFGKFNNIPAVICGAGPSLEKNAEVLAKNLDRAVVFAGGSALNALNAHFYQPHFGAGIDPNPMQYTRMSSNQGYEVPFFYRNRMFHDAFRMIHGPRLYITGCGGYEIAEFFEQKFNISAGFLDEGHNVVNFCVEVAQAMGCNPIIFAGLDLAFTGMKAYAPGIVEDAGVTKDEILEVDDYDSKALLRQDIFGQPTYTLWKWIAESEWIGDYAKSHPLLTMINCTEGGLGFPGIPNMPLAEAAKKYFTRQIELNDRIHGETQNSLMPKVTNRKMVQAMNELKESLKRTHDYLEALLQETKNAGSVQSGRAALAETELAEEAGYKHVIQIFNEVQSRVLSSDLHRINTSKHTEKLKSKKRLALNAKRLKFLRNAAQINIELIGYAFDEHKKHKRGKGKKISVPPQVKGNYSFKNDELILIDPELGLDFRQKFMPVRVPEKNPQNHQQLVEGCTLQVFYNDQWTLEECRVIKEGHQHGQSILYYPSGAVKEEMYYSKGKLHGPVTFWNESGQILAQSWFIEGKREGKVWWYYPSGVLYSLQRYRNGRWEGRQEFYQENGQIKTLMHYHQGKLLGSPILNRTI